MSRSDLVRRVRERMAKIKATSDGGYFAKFYVEDCTALLQELGEEPTEAEQRAREAFDRAELDDGC